MLRERRVQTKDAHQHHTLSRKNDFTEMTGCKEKVPSTRFMNYKRLQLVEPWAMGWPITHGFIILPEPGRKSSPIFGIIS